MGQLFSVPGKRNTDVESEQQRKKGGNLVIWVRMRRMESEKKPQKKCTCPYERPTLKPEEPKLDDTVASFNNNSTSICDTAREDGQHRTVISVINNNNTTVSNITDNEASIVNRLTGLSIANGATPKESKGQTEDSRESSQCVKKLLSTSGLKHKLCKLCRSHSCCSSMCKDGGKEKPKKQNWSLKFNCAKMKSSKTSPTVATEEKVNVCTCRKAKESAPRPVSSPPLVGQEIDEVPAEVARPSSSPASAAAPQNASNVILSTQHVQVFPGQSAAGAGALLLPDASFQTPTTTTTSTLLRSNGQLIHRIETTAVYSSLPSTPGPANVLLFMNHEPQLLDFSRFNPDDYPTEDCDEQARLQREREIEEGVEAPPGFRPRPSEATPTIVTPPVSSPPTAPLVHWPALGSATIQSLMQANRGATAAATPSLYTLDDIQHHQLALMQPAPQRVHSQVDYIHCLVPDLQKIIARSFYWCKMDRYQAEKLLEGKPEGTFLLRDSAQEDFLFSVSFRKYGRSLHARIEQFNHTFSFDSHDPSVFTATTVTGLLEHYKDPMCVMFFEPMLTLPLNRNFCFSLQQLCRATIVSRVTYDGINELNLPSSIKAYLKEYHYKQKVRVRRFDEYPYENEAS
ncbi:suppressor of cytokine signaling 5 isoform X2 [Phlebotomus argentipes]|uniref:suppressor of cytokine signaling 5 isoform X2 n=1 Tax=Phlebotomus argentipes TaxID=94469 RepID=UPI00289310A9|nr:suppressor of cytokine signaling 5 isoform X2 [Phlebotomus argentipes]